ncbi:MAG: M23 family metallopeptidase, partial [Aquificota bacterium]
GIFVPAEKIKPSDIYLKSLEKSISKFVNVMSDIPVGVPLYGRLTSRFGYRRDPFNGRLAFHTGIDLRATYKQPVRATANGVVVFSGWKRGYGKVVIIKHKYDFETIYAHLAWKRVGINQPVKAGDIIGYAGSTGRSTGVHLHYEIRRYGKLVNPLKLLYFNNTNTL